HRGSHNPAARPPIARRRRARRRMRQAALKTGTLTVHVPMTFAMRGGRKAVVSDLVQGTPCPRTESALLKALARAHRWRKLIEDGEFASITELARAKGVNESY